MIVPVDYKIGVGALVAVVLGWVLGQGSTIIRDALARRRTKAGLLVELEDIQKELLRIVTIHARAIQISAHNGLEWSVNTSPINAFFFEHNFKDVFARLNHDERRSYQYVHSAVEQVNRDNDDLARFLEKLRERRRESGLVSADFEEWSTRVQMAYRHARVTMWFVEHHLRNRKKPTLDLMGPVHEAFLEYQEKVDAETTRIRDEAKSLNPADFLKIHDPRAFERNKINDSD